MFGLHKHITYTNTPHTRTHDIHKHITYTNTHHLIASNQQELTLNKPLIQLVRVTSLKSGGSLMFPTLWTYILRDTVLGPMAAKTPSQVTQTMGLQVNIMMKNTFAVNFD